ncbi:MAG: TonB-dependent receptor [Tannerella sp.]|jgi:outer membrane cobalamin receptor|nr:TonB-dependent receptor [Tannerella sp.]
MRLVYATLIPIFTASTATGQNMNPDTVISKQLPDVEVVSKARPSVSKQSAPLQVLESDDIKRLGINELHEAVKRFSGVTVKDYGGIGGLKTVSIRSLGAHHTAVSYDGVAVADAQSGQIDISRFALDNVEMLSLSTGQSDDIFRTARLYASAGALEIKTQKPNFKDYNRSITTKLRGGSFGMFNPALTYNQKLGNSWSASLSSDYMRADSRYPFTLINGSLKTREKRINSDVETIRCEAGVYGELGKRGGRIETKLYFFDSERGLPGSIHLYDRSATERLWNDNAFVQSHYSNNISEKLDIQAIAKYSYSFTRYLDISDNYAAGQQEDRNNQQEYYLSTGFLYRFVENFSLSASGDYAHTWLNNNFLNALHPLRNTLFGVLAAQYKTDALTVTGSMLGAYISDEVSNGINPPVRKRLTPALSASWRPFRNKAFRIRASYKDIYRIPTFADLYYLRMGNSGLKPEDATQYNLGLTWSGSSGQLFNYLNITVDGYYNKVENKIVALPTLYIWRMLNMGEVEIKGLDVNVAAEIPLTASIKTILSGNYTFQSAVDITDSKSKNYRHQIPYTPRHTGNGSIAVETPWINLSWLLTAVGERYILPQNIKANRIDGYVEQNVSLNRTFAVFGSSLRLQGEILNIADTQYDVIQFYPMPGRSWRFSLIFIL